MWDYVALCAELFLMILSKDLLNICPEEEEQWPVGVSRTGSLNFPENS